jgi:hypothetical protein
MSNANQSAQPQAVRVDRENTSIWASVNTTEERYTKPFLTPSGTMLTAVNPTYQVGRATKLFGPCGIGWGYRVIEEKIIDGLVTPEGITLKTHVLRLELWYMHQGQRATLEHYGQTPFVGIRHSGEFYQDEEAPKKSLTDALMKALSMLGFSADVFLGDFEKQQQANAQTQGHGASASANARAAATHASANPKSLELSQARKASEFDFLREQAHAHQVGQVLQERLSQIDQAQEKVLLARVPLMSLAALEATLELADMLGSHSLRETIHQRMTELQ